MRSNDDSDSVARAMKKVENFDSKYELILDDDFADVYKLKFGEPEKKINGHL